MSRERSLTLIQLVLGVSYGTSRRLALKEQLVDRNPHNGRLVVSPDRLMAYLDAKEVYFDARGTKRIYDIVIICALQFNAMPHRDSAAAHFSAGLAAFDATAQRSWIDTLVDPSPPAVKDSPEAGAPPAQLASRKYPASLALKLAFEWLGGVR